MMECYAGLVRAYLRDGDENSLAAIAALRAYFVESDMPIEELVGFHERALLSLKDQVSADTFDDVVKKTSACLTELMIAYSLADPRSKGLLERERRIERERHRLEALGQMAGGIAHEFNNLLQPILGMAELAMEDAVPGSELAEQLTMILDSASQAAKVVRGVLTTARKQGPPPRPLLLGASLRKTVHFLAAIMPSDITLELAILCDDALVLCAEAELTQVLLNLVRNAADAMNGKGAARITLQNQARERLPEVAGAVSTEDCLCLTVADDGVGMSPDVAARVFQPFFTTKAPHHGTGLGLPIVMAIVRDWNATVDINTAPSEGTRISVIFPIVSLSPLTGSHS